MTASVSPEVIEKWRSEFEDYHGAHARLDNGRYADPADQTLWACWVKARKSAVINLPQGSMKKLNYDYSTGRNSGIVECRFAIQNQGYQIGFLPPHGE
jgi:hypothetical protein